MFTLFTGNPGAGKTAAGVELVADMVKDGRMLYVVEVPDPNVKPLGLKLPHVLLDGEKGREWQEHVPDGALVFIPEVHYLWPPRGPSVKPGRDILALATHRHRGIDFVADTQHPRQLDAAVKSLVGRHIHLRDTGWLGRWWYEWPELSETIAWKTCVTKRKWKLPKKVFGLYASASMHVKPVRGVPPMLYVAALLVLSLIALIFMGYRTITSKLEPKPEAETPALQVKASPASRQGGKVYADVTPVSLMEEAVPRLSARPETAPMYDHLRVVTVMPRIVGGYCQGSVCRCYTQQFTDPGIGPDACRAWLKSPPFDPYRVEQEERRDGDRPQAATAPASAPPKGLL